MRLIYLFALALLFTFSFIFESQAYVLPLPAASTGSTTTTSLLDDVIEATNAKTTVKPSATTSGVTSANSTVLDDVIEATNARSSGLRVIPNSNIGSSLVSQAELTGTAALSGYAAGALGLAGLAYYQHTGKDPLYVPYNIVASASDAIFVPAYQAFKANFVSPESFPASAAQYIGKEGSVGASLASIAELAKSFPGEYPLITQKIADSSTPGGYNDSQFFQGVVFNSRDGKKQISEPFVQVGWDPYSYYNMNAAYEESIRPGSRLTSTVHTSGEWIYKFVNGVGTFRARTVATSIGDAINPSLPSVNYETLKTALEAANKEAAFADEIRKAIKNTPSDQKITSSDPNPTTIPATQPSPITNNDVSNFFTSNTTNVYNEYLNTVNNGGDVDTGKAAAELAKAQEDEVEDEVDNEAVTPQLVLPEIRPIDFKPIIDAKDSIKNKAPFVWVSSIVASLNTLSTSAKAPSFQIPLFAGHSITCDLSIMDSLASSVRSCMAWVCYALTALLLIDRYRSM